MKKSLFTFLFLVFLGNCSSSKTQPENQKIQVGAEVLIENHLVQLKDKKVGLVMNPTARVNGTHMLDTLLSREVNITALFAPEHGFRGEAGAGEVIKDGVDQETGLPVYSLYGDSKKPTAEMLENVDVLLFDMQDVGARFYTYNVTLGLVLEAAAENDVDVWVLDRPNPAGGEYVAGWMLKEEHKSFVGAYPIPMAHGMTLGELAQMMVGEQWIEFDQKPDLKIVSMKGWERSMKWPETGLEWYPPSPNLPTFEHAYVYLGTVLFEGSNISEGRGTEDPFLTIGSPNTSLTDEDIQKLNKKFPSVTVTQKTFTPTSIPGKSLYPKFEDQECYGVSISVTDYDKLDPIRFGVELFELIYQSTEDAELKSFIKNLSGINIESIEDLNSGWQEEVSEFKKLRKPYLLY